MSINDAIENNFSKIKKSVDAVIQAQKPQYGLLIDKYMDEAFRSGVQAAEQDLNLKANSLYDFEKTAPERNILRENAKTINFELWDAIDKEITLMLSDIQLNNIPFTNTALKREMQTIFARHSARLASQVTTETTRATNQGIKWGYDKSGLVSHKQWAAIIDGKTSQICLDLNGEIREIGKAFSSGDYGPPAHVNCRSRIVKVTLTSKKE